MKIAVVGLGTLFPDAKNIAEFWQNIINKKVSIRPLPEEIFESEVFYQPGLLNAFDKEDKSTTRIAGWIENLRFDTVKKYKIPPSVAEHMDSNQHAALYTTGQALEMNSLKEVPNDRVAVIFGNGMVGTRYGDAMFRVQFQLMEHSLRKHADFQKLAPKEQEGIIASVRANVLKDTLPITEDSAPGVLPNIIAGRIASVFDFHGPSFTVDAACASVLAALIRGIQGLQRKEYDAVICGGSDMPLKQLGFVLFSALNALSPDGSYPFDQRANGFVMSQGAGTVILKRLEDAIQNQDLIYAVVTGYGEASDGKGKYIAAPNTEWQARTIEKACRMAGYPVDTIELIEAHGTATKVGDVVEVAALKQAFSSLGATRKNFCGLTSVKSNIGHLKSAAGIAGLIKAILALHQQTLPPTANFETINPKLELADSPFYILDEQREWHGKKDYPRRANVSSFGFGGADYHIALEEFRPADYRPGVFSGFSGQTAAAGPAATTPAGRSPAGPSEKLPQTTAPELVFFSAQTFQELDVQVQNLLATIRKHNDLSFAELCALHNYTVRAGENSRLAILADSPEELAAKHLYFMQNRDKPGSDLLKTRGIYFKRGRAITPAETAVLFPGQASQYLHMFHSIYDTYDSVRTWYRKADAYWFSRHEHTVSSLVFPSAASQDEAIERLRQTHNAHPSIFIASFALYDLLAQMGLSAQFMAGHSLGEITALAAAGKLAFDDALKLVEQRGDAFFQTNLADPGKMLSIVGSEEEARQLVMESRAIVTIANLNSPRQTIVAGSSPEIERFGQFLDEKKVKHQLLFVSHAFHTALLEPVAEQFYNNIKDIPFRKSPVRVTMNHSGAYYPDQVEALPDIPRLLRDQILQPVNFVGAVQNLYRDGVRLFVEVGPGSILSSLVKDILSERDASILTANFKNADDLASLQKLCGALFAEGVPVKLLSARAIPHAQPAAVTIQGQAAGPTETELPDPTKSTLPDRPADNAVAAGVRKVTIVYSGAAIGLPGSYKETFRDDNFAQLFEGHNLLERLTDEERQSLVDLQISKLIKDENGPTFKLLTTLDDVIQLAGKIGRIDLIRDYHIDEKIVQNTTSCIANGVAAGYEALKDAQIPLVREYIQTTTGKMLPQKLALPRAMQEETGVIFANGFPLIDPVIHEVSRYISYFYGSKTRKELMAFYESIISRIKDYEAKKLLTDWYTLYYSRLNNQPGQAEVYRFNHHFMTQISAQANNLLATLINAKGPNFQINAACSSTSNAITIAEDFIRSGRVKRMIVVGADDPTSKTNFPLLGAGFLCTGAATNEGDLYKAAIPFDRRRNGMLVGAGAVGIILETREEVEKRGVIEICELLGTHSFNTARHISQIDIDTFAEELEKFICRMEQEHGLRREQLAREAVYISHETFTPPRGGCSQTEAEALKRAFGDDFRKIIVGNTKGMTGHTMGASLEDAVAAKALQYGKCPPVVHYAQPDPLLDGMHLWQGGSHDRRFALKMSAGFGSQGHFALLKKTCSGDRRIVDRARYLEWLKTITSGAGPAGVPEQWGRILILPDQPPGLPSAPAAPVEKNRGSRPPEQKLSGAPAAAIETTTAPPAFDLERLEERIVELLSQLSGYPPEMLEPEMEFEADLGIGGEKLSTILNRLAGQFELPRAAIALTGEATIGQAIAQVAQELKKGAARPTNLAQPRGEPVDAGLRHPAPAAGPPAGAANEAGIKTAGIQAAGIQAAITAEALKVFSQVTKYPEEMLDLDMEMEADLGIDTVKQATILSLLGEKYQLERQEGLQLSNYPTIRHIVDLIYSQGKAVERAPEETASLEIENAAGDETSPVNPPTGHLALPEAGRQAEPGETAGIQAAITAEALKVFSQVTKYPEEMLDLDMEMEADLGIDTVKQATILSLLGEKYQLERQEGLQLSNYPTIRHIVELIYTQGKAVQREMEKPAAGLARVEDEATRPPQAASTLISDVMPTAPQHVWQTSLSRQVPVLVEEALGALDFDLAGKTVWILGDEPEVGSTKVLDRLASAFAEKQARVHIFAFPKSNSAEQIEATFAAFSGRALASGKAADVIVDCTHIGSTAAGSPPIDQLTQPTAQALLFMSSTARFLVYKHLSKSQRQHPARIICLTASDGCFGLDPAACQVYDPTFGALAGFYKGLRKEWSGSAVRILDFAPQTVKEAFADCCEAVLAEVERSGLGVEIAYRAGRRWVVKIEDKEIRPGARLAFSAQDTFLITGGGTGIAARIFLTLAQAYPANFVIVDLEPLPENIASLAALDETGLEQVKKDLHERLRRENPKVTPVLLNREFGKLTKAIEIYNNLNAARHWGRKVIYIPCDVRDNATLERALQQARQTTGPVTAILHAAGLDHSHLIDQKSVAEFQDVFSVKAQGAWNLTNLCRHDPVRLVVAFSSIAGRFGNAAQLDYSAANSFLNDWVKLMARVHSGAHTLSLVWSGWKEVGIAWRNEFVRQKSEEIGLNLIDVDQGIAAFMQEIENRSGDCEVLLHKGLNGFIEKGLASLYLPDFPLIDRITKKDGQIDRAYRLFSVQRDALIDQHRLGKVPIMPAVGYAELAVEYYALRAGRKAHYVLRDMTFANAFKLFREQPRELFIQGTPAGGAWSIEMLSSFKPPKSGEVQIILHSRATVSGELPDTSDLDPRQWPYHRAQPTSLPAEESLLLIQSEGPDQRIILGPLYNDVLREAKSKQPVLIYPAGTTYPTYFPQEQLANAKYPLQKLLVNPCLLDSLYQACAANLLVNKRRVYLPWEIRELGIVNVPRQEGLYTCHVQIVEETDEIVSFNVVMLDGDGKLCYFARQARFRLINL